jgi:mono/diheme cytochrome c family protein
VGGQFADSAIIGKFCSKKEEHVKLRFATVAIVMVAALALVAQEAKRTEAKKAESTHASAALIARGKYLVGPAGQCADCHTPTDKKGQPIQANMLQGAPILFKPTVPIPNWADSSLPIAGLPTMASDADAISFFTTGKHLDGKTAAPPMPQYRFSRRDAEAIIAYLKSLQ